MTMEQEHRAEWPQALRRYLGVSIVGTLVSEILQLPLYTTHSGRPAHANSRPSRLPASALSSHGPSTNTT